MTKKISILALIVSISSFVSAQKYDIVAGAKIADGIGISGAYRFADKYTAEILLKPSTFSEYSLGSIMAKRHFGILGSKRFNVFAGAGLFTLNHDTNLSEAPKVNAAGIGFTLGAELTMGRINISTDYMPLFTVNESTFNKDYYSNGGITVRYVFDKRETKVKQKWDSFKDKFKKKNKK
jgi:hypothetical protein